MFAACEFAARCCFTYQPPAKITTAAASPPSTTSPERIFFGASLATLALLSSDRKDAWNTLFSVRCFSAAALDFLSLPNMSSSVESESKMGLSDAGGAGTAGAAARGGSWGARIAGGAARVGVLGAFFAGAAASGMRSRCVLSDAP